MRLLLEIGFIITDWSLHDVLHCLSLYAHANEDPLGLATLYLIPLRGKYISMVIFFPTI